MCDVSGEVFDEDIPRVVEKTSLQVDANTSAIRCFGPLRFIPQTKTVAVVSRRGVSKKEKKRKEKKRKEKKRKEEKRFKKKI